MPSWVLASAFFGSSRTPSSYQFDGVVELLGLEIGRAELNRARPAFFGSFLMIVRQRLHPRLVQAGGCRSPAAAAGAWRRCGRRRRLRRRGLCGLVALASTQPTITPKHMPATVKTMDSDFMERRLLILIQERALVRLDERRFFVAGALTGSSRPPLASTARSTSLSRLLVAGTRH